MKINSTVRLKEGCDPDCNNAKYFLKSESEKTLYIANLPKGILYKVLELNDYDALLIPIGEEYDYERTKYRSISWIPLYDIELAPVPIFKRRKNAY